MFTFFIILICLVSFLMIFIVLIQESKGGGLSSNFSSSNQIMGVRKTTDFVEKATWGLAIAMVVLSIFCAYSNPKGTSEQSAAQDISVPTPGQNQPIPVSNTAAGADAKEGAAPAKEGAAAPAKENAAPAKEDAAKAPAAPAETPAK